MTTMTNNLEHSLTVMKDLYLHEKLSSERRLSDVELSALADVLTYMREQNEEYHTDPVELDIPEALAVPNVVSDTYRCSNCRREYSRLIVEAEDNFTCECGRRLVYWC